MRICANKGVAWNQPSISTCMGQTAAALEVGKNRLFKDTPTGTSYWKFNSTLITLPALNTPTRSCVPSDAFSLSASFNPYFEYDISKLPGTLLQSQLVTHPTWSDTSVNINLFQLNADFSMNQSIPIISNAIQLPLPTDVSQAGTNISIYILVMHRLCAVMVDQPISLA